MDLNNVSATSSKNVTGAAATTDGKAATSSATLDYNAFLQLLIAQLKNQDPLEPMKSSDYVAQLATFSQVEKSVQMNERLGDLLISSQLAQAEGLIGRTVTSEDGTRSGTVTATRIGSGGVIAVLQNGQELRIGPGVTVSDSAA